MKIPSVLRVISNSSFKLPKSTRNPIFKQPRKNTCSAIWKSLYNVFPNKPIKSKNTCSADRDSLHNVFRTNDVNTKNTCSTNRDSMNKIFPRTTSESRTNQNKLAQRIVDRCTRFFRAKIEIRWTRFFPSKTPDLEKLKINLLNDLKSDGQDFPINPCQIE